MPSTTVQVGSHVGLHAKPAGMIAAAVRDSGHRVTMHLAVPREDDEDQEPVDASSALMIMTLGARHGDIVVVTCDHEATLDQVAELVRQDLSDAPVPPLAAQS